MPDKTSFGSLKRFRLPALRHEVVGNEIRAGQGNPNAKGGIHKSCPVALWNTSARFPALDRRDRNTSAVLGERTRRGSQPAKAGNYLFRCVHKAPRFDHLRHNVRFKRIIVNVENVYALCVRSKNDQN